LKRQRVGSIGVDTGGVCLIDPGYIYHHPELFCTGQTIEDGKKKIKLPDKWDEFVKKRFDKNNTKHSAVEMYGGVFCQTQNGDGEYPVYVTKDKDGAPVKLEIDLTYSGMQVADLDNEEASEKIQEGLSYLEDEEKIKVLSELLDDYCWFEPSKNQGATPFMAVYQSLETSEETYQKYWDNQCIWKPDYLQAILSGVYRSGHDYSKAIEEFSEMSWNELPEMIKNQIRMNCEGVTEEDE
jgi:hypothetical protein